MTRAEAQRGRVKRAGESGAACACGWSEPGESRRDAQRRARDHRREKAVELAERDGLADRLRDLPAGQVAAVIARDKAG